MMQSNMGLYVNQGLLQLSGDRVIMDGGALQIGVRFAKEEEVSEADKGKVAGPWAGGATKRAATGGASLPATTTPATALAAATATTPTVGTPTSAQ